MKRPVSSHVDKWLFFAVFAIGSAGIIWLKLNDYSQFWVTAWPVGLMVIYIGDILLIRRFRVREDVAADNVYYLGFLYTMVSLSLALYLFDQTGSTATVITSFGIALATTILGLFGRILINQFRQDPMEVERVSRLELSEASVNLRSELDTIVLDMKSFHRSLLQSSAEMIEEAKQGALGSIAKAREHLDQHEQNVIDLKTASSDTVTALKRLINRIDRIEAPSDLLTQKLDPLVRAITATADATAKRSKADHDRIRQMDEMIRTTIAMAAQNDKRASDVEATVEKLHGWLTDLGQLRETLEASYRNLNDDVGKHTAIMTRMRAALSQHLDAVEEQIREDVANRRAAIAVLSENTDEARKLVSEHNSALKEQLDMIGTLYERLDATVVGMLEMTVARLGAAR